MTRSLLFALLAALLVPASARAYVRSLAEAPDGSAGPCLFWRTDSPSYVLNQAGSATAGAAESLAAARASFATWTQPSCTGLRFVDDGLTARSDVGFDQTANDNINLVVWREVSCTTAAPVGDPCYGDHSCNNKYNCWDETIASQDTIALTTTTYSYRTGEIFDADIEMNGADFVFTAVDGLPCPSVVPQPPDCVATDIQNTLTHEIGHFIGLDHTPVKEATMAATASNGETSKRSLAQDDIDGLCVIYPAGSAPVSCAPGEATTTPTKKGCGCASSEAAAPWLALAPLAVAMLRRRRGGV